MIVLLPAHAVNTSSLYPYAPGWSAALESPADDAPQGDVDNPRLIITKTGRTTPSS